MDFIALLKEKAIDRHTRWLEAKKKIDSDPRYKAVEASGLKEDYFREYCKMVKEGKKKDKEGKEKDRSKKEKKEKDRDKESKREKKKEKAEKHTEQASEDVPKQPTPPPDQWADILGIPGGGSSNAKPKSRTRKSKGGVVPHKATDSSDEEIISPKQLRSSRKENAAASSPVLLPTAVQVSDSEPLKLIIKSPPKKRKFDNFIFPEPEEKKKKSKRKESTKPSKAETVTEAHNEDNADDENAENVESNIQEMQEGVKVAKTERKKRKKTEKQ